MVNGCMCPTKRSNAKMSIVIASEPFTGGYSHCKKGKKKKGTGKEELKPFRDDLQKNLIVPTKGLISEFSMVAGIRFIYKNQLYFYILALHSQIEIQINSIYNSKIIKILWKNLIKDVRDLYSKSYNIAERN